MIPRELARITKLTRVGDHYTARVHHDGQTVDVDNRYGSWRIVPENGRHGWDEVHPAVAALLAKRVKQEERRAKRAA